MHFTDECPYVTKALCDDSSILSHGSQLTGPANCKVDPRGSVMRVASSLSAVSGQFTRGMTCQELIMCFGNADPQRICAQALRQQFESNSHEA